MALAALLTASCAAPGTIVEDRFTEVRVPVAAPCAGERPAIVSPLRERFTDGDWAAMDVRQKAAAVSRQGLDLRTYGEKLDAATAGCPPSG